MPAGTVALDAVVTVPTVRPAPVIAVVAAACVRPTTFGIATCGSVELMISTAAMFQRSVVGAVTFIVVSVPLDAIGAVRVCTQNVSPTAKSTHSCTIVWPAASVRSMA